MLFIFNKRSLLHFQFLNMVYVHTSFNNTRLNFICKCLATCLASSVLLTGISIEGVLIAALATIRISLNLGIPKVTFISPRPAKWKVFNVIWVEGSPIDWNIYKCIINKLKNLKLLKRWNLYFISNLIHDLMSFIIKISETVSQIYFSRYCAQCLM